MVTPLVAPMGLWALLTPPVEGLDVYPTLGCYGDFDLLCQAGATDPVGTAGGLVVQVSLRVFLPN